ncbi:hypothetical protein [Flavobacterium suzhouense]|uniref:CMP/dCMP-type deaminase domain-containing protein n=1 Tax=Flavobacterium suzhouense TaxID=1529638 RepID=A0ABW5NUP7_9FLAO
MKLKKLYSLRKDFTVIGLTGRVGSGCSEIAKKLAEENFTDTIIDLVNAKKEDAEEIKYRICAEFLSHSGNWTPFKIIHYRDALLLHLFFEATRNNPHNPKDCISSFISIICQNGEKEDFSNRFDKSKDTSLVDKIEEYLLGKTTWFDYFKSLTLNNMNDCISNGDKEFHTFFFGFFENFSYGFYEILNRYDITKRTRLIHDFSNNLRDYGTVCIPSVKEEDDMALEHIYTVAITINRIIKNWRFHNDNIAKIVIDALKNSLELMYFKEKFSAFYMVATNKDEKERFEYILTQVQNKYQGDYTADQIKQHAKEILKLDEAEYDGGEFNEGVFSSPDTENCIQKSDYHIFFSNKYTGFNEKTESEKEINRNYANLNLRRQLVKLIALIHQPGIITPSAIERCMQIAYNAKFNSGCISRQVGALVTDNVFTVKAIGWNDVPQNQMPCRLRNAKDLASEDIKNPSHFSEFEKGNIDESAFYKDGKNYKQKFTEIIEAVDLKNLEGKNCSYCFKSFHNAFEGEKNQVHTRSLHAEENAMLQISKYGGQGLKGGNLFTTASPCELCSKKAFQLGITNIYYIDPYPGISIKHILKNGVQEEKNPALVMFQGGVGRAFHKLYEPFMAYKDELSILTGINPKVSQQQKIEKLTDDESLQLKIAELITQHAAQKTDKGVM